MSSRQAKKLLEHVHLGVNWLIVAAFMFPLAWMFLGAFKKKTQGVCTLFIGESCMFEILINRGFKQLGPELPDHFQVDLETMDLQVFGMDRQVLSYQFPGIENINILLGNVLLLLDLVAPVGHPFLPVK